MNVNDVVRRVRTFVGDSGGNLVSLNEAIDLINDAQIEINQRTKQIVGAFIFNTAVGDYTIDPPADSISVRRVYLNGGYLTHIPHNQLVSILPSVGDPSQNRGTPSHYSVEGRLVYLYPTPDAIYAGQLEYVQIPPAVDDGTDNLSLPAYLQPLVARMLLAYYKERDEDFEAAQLIKQEVFQQAASLVAQALDNQEESYPVVRDTDYEAYGIYYG